MGTTQKQTRLRGNKSSKSKSSTKIKSKAEFAASQAEKKPLIGNEPAPKQVTPDDLRSQIEFFENYKNNAVLREARCQDLMGRKSANGWISQASHLKGKFRAGWDAAKKAKMVRRFMNARKEIEMSVGAILELNERLEQLLQSRAT